jgi:hypothetical protein
VVFFYKLCRIFIFFLNKNFFNGLTIITFLGGLHFDFSAIAHINIIFAIMHFVQGNFKKDKLIKTNLISTEKQKRIEMERFIKAYLQSFNERIINNQLAIH